LDEIPIIWVASIVFGSKLSPFKKNILSILSQIPYFLEKI
jgi:hypothetical protein